MPTLNLARSSAILFGLWGLLHLAGGAAILAALTSGPADGYSLYQQSGGDYPALAGAILAYLAFIILVSGLAVTVLSVRMSWRNEDLGLFANLVIAGLLDLGLITFLVIPGFVSWPEAGIGLVLLVAGAVTGVLGRRSVPDQREAHSH